MRLRNRFALVTFGILVFIIATPLLVLYARGFKYDFKTGHVTKTGALVVRTEPDKALVYLSGEVQQGSTPLNIRLLLPGDYDVRIQKDGYQPWSKRLSIREQFVTWANADREFVTLFLAQPQLEQTINSNYVSISKNRGDLAYLKNNEIHVLETGNDRDKVLGPVATNTNFDLPLVWSDSDKIFEFVTKEKFPLKESQLDKLTKIETNNQQTALLLNSDLYSVGQNNTLNLVEHEVLDFTLDKDNIWYLKKDQIKRWDTGGNMEVIYKSLPEGQTGNIIRAPNQIYFTLDRQLYAGGSPPQKINSNVNFANWDEDSNRLLFGNDHEILLFDPASQNTQLILRSSSVVSQPQLNSQTGCVFFANEGQIKAVELDSRDFRNIYSLVDARKDLVVSKDGKRLYVFGNDEIKQYLIK